MSEIKRLKRDAPPSFKKKSNEEQFKANKSVMEAVEDASVALEHKDLLRTKEALDQGMSLLKDQQKLILLAKSPYGWKTVLEYKHHGLADDKEDKKKIYRAEARAARASKHFAPHGLGLQCRSGIPVSRNSQLTIGQIPNSFTRVNQQLSVGRSAGLCFFCGKPGHWRASCPNVLSSSNPANQQAK